MISPRGTTTSADPVLVWYYHLAREQDMSWYRIQDKDRDASALLDPANWLSYTWNDGTVPCPSCNAATDDCPDCKGSGWRNLSDMPRRGVSCCDTVERLAGYAEKTSMDLEDCVLIELDGDVSDDEDYDAAAGAVLILPETIISVTPLADVEEFAELLDEAY